MKSIIRSKNGITLVALVVTIIILLILAGITISELTGSGLFENTRLAEQKSKEAQEKEEGILADYENQIGKYIDSSRDTVTLSTEQFNGIMDRLTNLENKVNSLEDDEYNAGAEYLSSSAKVNVAYNTYADGASLTLQPGNWIVFAAATPDTGIMGSMGLNISNLTFSIYADRISSVSSRVRVTSIGYLNNTEEKTIYATPIHYMTNSTISISTNLYAIKLSEN